jgi:hypothetical protein
MIKIDTPHPGLSVHEVLGGSARDLEDLLAVHRELFAKFSSYIPYMVERAKDPPDADPHFVEHWWLARIDGEPAGIRYFKYAPARHCGLSLGIAVLKPYRHITFGRYGRFSKLLTLTSLEQLQADAAAAGQPVPVGIVAEVEDYLLPRYDEYDFIRLPIDYNEPSTTPEASAARGEETGDNLSFRPIQLGVFKLADTQFDPFNRQVLRDMVLAFLVDHYSLPDDHPMVRRALESIQNMPEAKDD